jgi:hypothetical protein
MSSFRMIPPSTADSTGTDSTGASYSSSASGTESKDFDDFEPNGAPFSP